MRLAFAFALLAALPGAARAEIYPMPGSGDPRIQSVIYDPAEVVALRVVSGYAVTVRFSPDERIETVTLGDPGSWSAQVNKRADNLVVKPLGPGMPTNLTVITDQRTYNFALYSTAGMGESQPYLLSFVYPALPQLQSASATPMASPYRLKGDRSLWPLSISDDGHFTIMRWPEESALPAVYREDAKGKLALVNGVMRGDDFVVEGVPDRLVFVLGKARARARRVDDGAAP
jgi:type IV secretion system protein VirB9